MLRSLFKPVMVLAALVGGTGLLLPDKFLVERSLEMHGVPYDLYAEVTDFSGWGLWSPWSADLDSSAAFTLSNDPEGEGAFLRYRGTELGNGELRVLSVDEENGVEINWIVNGGSISRFSFRAEDAPNRLNMLLVTWSNSGTLGWNPLLRWQAFLMRDRTVGKAMEESLVRLRKRMKDL